MGHGEADAAGAADDEDTAALDEPMRWNEMRWEVTWGVVTG